MIYNKIYYRYIVAATLVLLPVFASAHQPNFVDSQKWVRVNEPEISKAYYGVLPNAPVRYVISTTEPFDLYVGLLVPDLSEVRTNISAEIIYQDGTVIAKLVGEKFEWEKWHEEFAGDDYLKGPEFKKNVPAGTYTIIVQSPDSNYDKYVLVVGEKEKFSILKYGEMEKQIYDIKTKFFEKPWYAVFEGKIGGYQLIFLIAVLVTVFVGYKIKKWQ